MTDTQRVLKLFRENPSMELNHRIIVVEMGISEYTGRLKNARDMIGCTCGTDKDTCSASEHIINTRKGFYKYVSDRITEVIEPKGTMVNLEELKQKRLELVKKYKQAKSSGNQFQMRLIEAQGKMIRHAIDKHEQVSLIKETLF